MVSHLSRRPDSCLIWKVWQKFSRASTTVLRFKEHTFKASNYDELKDAVERGFVLCYWAGTTEEEKRVRKKPRPPFASFHWSNPLNLGSVS